MAKFIQIRFNWGPGFIYVALLLLSFLSLEAILSNHTCDLELRVRVPQRDIDVVVAAYADNVLKKAGTHDPDLGIYHWNIERPILAYQGINVSWKPKT